MQELDGSVKIYQNFEKMDSISPVLDFSVEKIFGGTLLGVQSQDFLEFYDWNTGGRVRPIDGKFKNVTSDGASSFPLLAHLVTQHRYSGLMMVVLSPLSAMTNPLS